MTRISKMGVIILPILFVNIGLSLAQNSVLSSGNWYEIAAVKDGIYKLSYTDLQNLGINVSSIDPRNLRLYGNGGGMLPSKNSDPRPVDLIENSIEVIGESDGKFDSGDYVLFYGQSQDRWKYDTIDGHFHHSKNIYSDTTCYFLNVGTSPGKRMQHEPSLTVASNRTIAQYDDYAFHELDSLNFLHSGRAWYGEGLTIPNHLWSNSFYFPSIFSSGAYSQFSFLGRSGTSSMNIACWAESWNGNATLPKTNINSITSDFAALGSKSVTFNTTSDTVTVSLDLTSADPNALAWVDFVEVNVLRQLKKTSGQNVFRSLYSLGTGSVSDFNISNTTSGDSVWDVTNPFNVQHVNTTYSIGTTAMRLATDSLKEFIISSAFLSATLIGQIPNQNLHAVGPVNMLIITHPDFFSAAQSLASLHQSHDGLTVAVATTAQIYNEFSSGANDVNAIRDFIRMAYLKSTSLDSLQYVLLFGDASYDYKNRLPSNTNFVPAYESVASLNLTNSYTSDDFFTLLDNNEGVWDPNSSNELPDVGIGRLPAKTLQEATNMSNKIARYCSSASLGDWRKVMMFAADDQDQNTHFNQTETLASMIDTEYCEYNIQKIYLDAFVQDTTGGVQTYPDVNKAINDRVNNGALFINWVGHGNEYQWANEKVLDTTMVNNFNNFNFLPFFLCATSDFGLMDDPSFVSGGERLLLNSNGGSIGSLTPTRLAFSGSNFSMSQKFFQNLLLPQNNSMPRLGDIMKQTKIQYNDRYTRNFVFLGDPAVRLAYPENKVVTTKINGQAVSGTDSLRAGSAVTVEGEIATPSGTLLNSFNGLMNVVVFDHEMTKHTLGNDLGYFGPGGQSYPAPFKAWSDTIFAGTVSVANGLFTFSFTMPVNIDSIFSFCKISYYAQNGNVDAGGCYDNALIGGGIRNGIDEIYVQSGVRIYPNPLVSSSTLQLNSPVKEASVIIYDMLGHEMMRKRMSGDKMEVEKGSLESGVYFVKVSTDEKQYVQKIIVE